MSFNGLFRVKKILPDARLLQPRIKKGIYSDWKLNININILFKEKQGKPPLY